MLNTLVVKNIALIEKAEIEFGPGLNVLSGETGSGKSVILDSINFVLGAKADKNMIRYGETECSVSAVFQCRENQTVLSVLRDMDIEPDEEVIVSRKYRADGRGDIKVNGCSVNAAMLRKIISCLVDVHGQSEHFYLLSETNQLKVLDKAAGAELETLKSDLSVLIEERKNLQSKLSALGGDEKERGRRLDILKYQIDEIERANLQEGEEETLATKKNFYLNIEKIMRALSEAAELISGDNAAVDCLNGAKRALSEISSLSAEYDSLSERMESVALEVEDIGETLSSLSENLFYDEREAEEVENRLDLIKSLKKKYGDTVAKILSYAERISEEYDLLAHCDEEFERLTSALKKNHAAIYGQCIKITALRKKTAQQFCSSVTGELKTLNIKNAEFCAEFAEYSEEDASRATQDGLDRMQFMFSANAGEPLKPLNKVISGGEMSRLMLAIKTRISDLNEISTYIFDEIDTGISGATAKTVAEKFADIAKRKQIIAVSHLAQIAAMADENFLISKAETAEGKTLTNIRKLSQEQKKIELMRLLGGDSGSSAAGALADELVKFCTEYKAK